MFGLSKEETKKLICLQYELNKKRIKILDVLEKNKTTSSFYYPHIEEKFNKKLLQTTKDNGKK